jgi:hypothetical protein
MPDCGVFAGRLAFKEKVIADGSAQESAADVAGVCVRRHVDASELRNGGSNRPLRTFPCSTGGATVLPTTCCMTMWRHRSREKTR